MYSSSRVDRPEPIWPNTWQPVDHEGASIIVTDLERDIHTKLWTFCRSLMEVSIDADHQKFLRLFAPMLVFVRERCVEMEMEMSDYIADSVVRSIDFAICCYYDLLCYSPVSPVLSPSKSFSHEECHKQLLEFIKASDDLLRLSTDARMPVIEWISLMDDVNPTRRRVDSFIDAPSRFNLPEELTLRPIVYIE